MSILVWVLVGIALWHFTVLLPDRFHGGIIGAFLYAVDGRRAHRLGAARRPACRRTTHPGSRRRCGRSPARSPRSGSPTGGARDAEARWGVAPMGQARRAHLASSDTDHEPRRSDAMGFLQRFRTTTSRRSRPALAAACRRRPTRDVPGVRVGPARGLPRTGARARGRPRLRRRGAPSAQPASPTRHRGHRARALHAASAAPRAA